MTEDNEDFYIEERGDTPSDSHTRREEENRTPKTKTPKAKHYPREKKTGNEDFYTEDGNLVFTEAYLKKRGYCCESGCRHCPYGFGKEK